MSIIKNTCKEILWKSSHTSTKISIETAVKKNVALLYANLSGANLSEANLTGARLSKANLSGGIRSLDVD